MNLSLKNIHLGAVEKDSEVVFLSFKYMEDLLITM